MNAVERAQQLAEKAREGERRTWWLVWFASDQEPVPVMFVPPRTQVEVLAFPGGRYSHCGVQRLMGDE